MKFTLFQKVIGFFLIVWLALCVYASYMGSWKAFIGLTGTFLLADGLLSIQHHEEESWPDQFARALRSLLGVVLIYHALF